jgi:hypothetical protein
MADREEIVSGQFYIMPCTHVASKQLRRGTVQNVSGQMLE